jgi:hypothetical protein
MWKMYLYGAEEKNTVRTEAKIPSSEYSVKLITYWFRTVNADRRQVEMAQDYNEA